MISSIIKSQRFALITVFLFLCSWIFFTSESFAKENVSLLNLNLGEKDGPSSLVPAMRIFFLMTILAVAPAILLMMTSFTRIVIVLSFVRQAVGTQTMPPNQVIVGLSLFLTFFTMTPLWEKIDEKAIKPYVEKKIDENELIDLIKEPLKDFMLTETRADDLNLFHQIAKMSPPEDKKDLSITTIMPAFMISELKTSFQMGFLIYIPFLIIDMVISSILMAMGMMMLPPTVVSLPFKLALFVLVDGWSMIVSSLVRSFQIFH